LHRQTAENPLHFLPGFAEVSRGYFAAVISWGIKTNEIDYIGVNPPMKSIPWVWLTPIELNPLV
jgi:hypothetical protein